MNDPEDLIDRLIKHQLPFVIVGDYAAFAHGKKNMGRPRDLEAVSQLKHLIRIDPNNG